MSKVKVAKAIILIAKTIGWLLLAAVVCIVVLGLFKWAVGHFLSFAIVFGILGAVGLLCAAMWADDVIKEDKQEEEFFQKHQRYETEVEKRDRKRREELRDRASRGY